MLFAGDVLFKIIFPKGCSGGVRANVHAKPNCEGEIVKIQVKICMDLRLCVPRFI